MKHPTSNIQHPTSKRIRKALHPMFIVLRLRTLAVILFFAFDAVSFAADTNTALLFSFFRGNGEDGLQLAWSTNGLQWTELKPPAGKGFLPPTVGGKIMRDPCLRQGPDGVFRLVWTTSWGQPPVFGYAQSADLVHWTDVKAVPVMPDEPTVENVWAPELFYNEQKGEWIVFWASTIPGKFPETTNSGDHNHRIYCVTTKDFKAFSPTKLFYDGGFNVIDATILPANGKFYLVVKDETKNPVKKNLRLAEGEHADGPFSKAGEPITQSWVEGPSAIQLGDNFQIYFDHYGSPQHYGAVKSTDLKHWQDISADVSFPKGSRHGTVSFVPENLVKNLSPINNSSTTKTQP
jgi:Glycosyl hydrolases family 43